MAVVDGAREHDGLAQAERFEREAVRRRGDVRERPQHRAQAADLDTQAGTMRFVRVFRAKRRGNERVSRHVAGPCLAEQAGEHEQHRAARERHGHARVAHRVAACIDDECVRFQQRLDLVEQHESRRAARDEPRGRRIEHARGRVDFGGQRGDAGVPCGRARTGEGHARRVRADAAHRDAGRDQFVRRA